MQIFPANFTENRCTIWQTITKTSGRRRNHEEDTGARSESSPGPRSISTRGGYLAGCSHHGGGSLSALAAADGALTHGPLTTSRVARIALPEHDRGEVKLKPGTTTYALSGLYTGDDLEEAFKEIPESGYFEITLSPGAYDVTGLTYKGSATIKIKGTGSARYGMDVLIHGKGTDMGTQSTRSTLSFQGACNIILENIAIENTHRETKGDAQAETLGVSNTAFSGTLAAYNCAFISGQDTICTEGKAWFYDCYVEGDVDFLWMNDRSSKVALYENCRIRATSGRADRAYFTAPRLKADNTVGKGVVIWKSTLEAEDGFKEVFLGRNPWDEQNDKDKGTNYFKDYYENVAIVGTKYYGPALSGAIWRGSGANGTENQQFVGFKTDSNFRKSSSGLGARLTAAQVSAEYSDRNKILNRVYNVAEEKFENDAASGIWDIAALEEEFDAGASGELEQDVFDEKSAKVTWDFASAWKDDNGNSSIQSSTKSGILAGTVNGSDEYTVKMFIDANVNGQGGKFEAQPNNSRTQINAGTVLTVPVTNGSVVAIKVNKGTLFGIEGETTTTYTHSGDKTGIVIYCTANDYITEVAVSKLDLTALDDGLKNATAKGSVRAIALDITEATVMNGKTTTLTATPYASYGTIAGATTWKSGNESVATVDNGVVTVKANTGTAVITATNNGHSASCTITAKATASWQDQAAENATWAPGATTPEVSGKTVVWDNMVIVAAAGDTFKNHDGSYFKVNATTSIVLYIPMTKDGTITIVGDGNCKHKVLFGSDTTEHDATSNVIYNYKTSEGVRGSAIGSAEGIEQSGTYAKITFTGHSNSYCKTITRTYP